MRSWEVDADPARLGGSTLADVDERHTGRASAYGHRAVTAVLAVVVGLGAAGLLGVHTSTASDGAGSWEVTVDYPRVARPGLDVTLTVTVRDAEPLPAEVVLTLDVAYLHIFEAQAIYPEPDAQSGDGGRVSFSFTPEPGATELVVDFDQYVQPGSQRGAATTAEVSADGRPTVVVPLRTTLAP